MLQLIAIIIYHCFYYFCCIIKRNFIELFTMLFLKRKQLWVFHIGWQTEFIKVETS